MTCFFLFQASEISDPAIVHLTKGGHQRYPTAENELIPAPPAQQIHGITHYLPARFAMQGQHTCAVEKIQLDQIESPLIEYNVEDVMEVIANAGIINIQ